MSAKTGSSPRRTILLLTALLLLAWVITGCSGSSSNKPRGKKWHVESSEKKQPTKKKHAARKRSRPKHAAHAHPHSHPHPPGEHHHHPHPHPHLAGPDGHHHPY